MLVAGDRLDYSQTPISTVSQFHTCYSMVIPSQPDCSARQEEERRVGVRVFCPSVRVVRVCRSNAVLEEEMWAKHEDMKI